MNTSTNFLLIIKIFILLSSSVHSKNVITEERIVGGHEASPNSHPYIVSLQARFLWIRAHICGGTILNERWILTAAHCTAESWLLRMLPMDAIAGAHDVNNFGPKVQIMPIKERIPHPLYEGEIGPYDIAMLKTVSRFEFTKVIKPINLPIDNKIRSTDLSLVGWGLLRTTTFIPDLPDKLQEVKVTYIPYNECYIAINELLEGDETNPLDKEAHVCTGPLSGGIAACSGDSGGPLVNYVTTSADEPNDSNDSVEDNTEPYDSENYNCTYIKDSEEGNKNDEHLSRQNKEDRIPVVVGVVSWGISPCGKEGAPTVYTNVTNYLDFINYFLNEENYI